MIIIIKYYYNVHTNLGNHKQVNCALHEYHNLHHFPVGEPKDDNIYLEHISTELWCNLVVYVWNKRILRKHKITQDNIWERMKKWIQVCNVNIRLHIHCAYPKSVTYYYFYAHDNSYQFQH